MSKIVEILRAAFGDDCVLTHEKAAMRVASNWRQNENLNCLALLRPQNTEQLSKMLQICNEFNQPLVPHGGLTNVVGGTVTKPNEIALSLERMNMVEEINAANKTVTVQAGVVLQNLQKISAENGTAYPRRRFRRARIA